MTNLLQPTTFSPTGNSMKRTLAISTKLNSVGLLSTFPPTACGLATFSAALMKGLETVGVGQVNVVRVTEAQDSIPLQKLDPHVISEWRLGSSAAEFKTASILNAHDAVIVQHEFGIFDGPDGANLLSVLANIQAPIVTTLHTVPLQPTANQKRILEAIVDISSSSVTMTKTAHQRLIDSYHVDPAKLALIPHGATLPRFTTPPPISNPLLLTWGLIGPGKGIEWAIEAFALLKDSHPDLRYLVAGRTHPKVFAMQGEQYRESLIELTRKLGIEDRVTFDDSYRSLDQLLELLAQTSCVVLPYDSTDQITSGVLVDAIASGRPVVATNFPHAAELLSSGAGKICPHKDPESLARAIHESIASPTTLLKMHDTAKELAIEHSWYHIAHRYLGLVTQSQAAIPTSILL
jgi:glycosyltransferase involved in cell wall biosynthesis